MKTDFKIDLLEGLKDPEKAKEVVKQVQGAIDELVLANQELKKQLEIDIKKFDEAAELIKNLQEATINATEVIKNLNIVLNSKRELFKDDEEMEVVMKALAHFVTGAGAIKMGVLANEKN
jgi:hypothetical protein